MTQGSILIVEDAAITAAVLQEVIERLGYRVCGNVASGEEAIRTAEAERPDLVLMDIQLKGEMDGIEAAGIIRQRVGSAVVFLTAFAAESVLQRARLSGPFGYLVKPVKDSDLRSTIEMALYKSRLDREKELLADELARVEKLAALGRMMSGFIHSLANPLHAIQAHVELAQLELSELRLGEGDRLVRESLTSIESEAGRLTDIVQRLRVITRSQPATADVVDPLEVLQQVIEASREQMASSGISVAYDWPRPSPMLTIGREHLRLMFADLVQNSVTSLSSGGAIRARATVAPDPSRSGVEGILMEISDTGEGFPQKSAERFFEPFASSNPRRPGLGLFSVSSLASYYDGAVTANSEPGIGTTVAVWLPIAKREADVPSSASRTAAYTGPQERP